METTVDVKNKKYYDIAKKVALHNWRVYDYIFINNSIDRNDLIQEALLTVWEVINDNQHIKDEEHLGRLITRSVCFKMNKMRCRGAYGTNRRSRVINGEKIYLNNFSLEDMLDNLKVKVDAKYPCFAEEVIASYIPLIKEKYRRDLIKVVLKKYFINGWTYAEVSRYLGLKSTSTVKNIIKKFISDNKSLLSEIKI